MEVPHIAILIIYVCQKVIVYGLIGTGREVGARDDSNGVPGGGSDWRRDMTAAVCPNYQDEGKTTRLRTIWSEMFLTCRGFGGRLLGGSLTVGLKDQSRARFVHARGFPT